MFLQNTAIKYYVGHHCKFNLQSNINSFLVVFSKNVVCIFVAKKNSIYNLLTSNELTIR